LPNQRTQRTAKSVTPFAIAKVPPFFADVPVGEPGTTNLLKVIEIE
jgi:hypothetical protein